MIGYVARDSSGALWFHYSKPARKGILGKELYWESVENDNKAFQIFDSDFPEFKNLKWEDRPIRVGFNIHKANIQD